jgi:filamentous hemagglutinin
MLLGGKIFEKALGTIGKILKRETEWGSAGGSTVGKVTDAKLTATAKAEKEEFTNYFRVEGGGQGNATSQSRITANPDGSISINPGCRGQLCVSVENSDHAVYYLTNKRPDGYVVVFEVDAKLHKKILENAVPQRPIPEVPRDPAAPKIVDVDQPGISLELPKYGSRYLNLVQKMLEFILKRNF